MLQRPALAAVLFTAAAALATANTYTVTSTADSGAGTLRQAITDANGNPGADTIAFNIVGSGVHTVAPTSALPAITGPVTIDGYTQPGSAANTNPTGQGLNTILRIEIDGTGSGSSACLSVAADDVTIRGLAINRCAGPDIETPPPSHQNLVVEGCFLGSSADGTQALSPYQSGVNLVSAQNARIGGTTPAARNLVSGGDSLYHQITIGADFGANSGHLVQGNLIGTNAAGTARLATNGTYALGILTGTGVTIGGTSAGARNVIVNAVSLGYGWNGTTATGNLVRGNFIGTDVTGLIPLGCYAGCILVYSQGNVIGGSAAGSANVVAGGIGDAGIEVRGDGTVIQGNFIGTDPTQTALLGNGVYAVLVYATGVTIGGIGAGQANVIANNGPAASGQQYQGAGILVVGSQVSIRGNSIYDTSALQSGDGLGIDLYSNSSLGVTLNDAGDGDSGANGLQNFPIISSVTYGASTTTVTGTLSSTAATVFDVDFYANPACSRRPQDLPEGKTYLGSTQVTTDGSGDASFNTILPIAVANGSPITATATDPNGNTSEFTPRFVLSMFPGSGPPSGYNSAQIKGLAFVDGATVTVGGVAATGVSVDDANTIFCNIPALPAGSINTVVVQNPGNGLSGALPNGWIAYFNDVQPGNQFLTQVTKLVSNGITAGVGGGNYGVAASTLRQQMAVFLLKAKYGVCYAPPPCTGVFSDVPCSSNFAPWIEALAAEGITGGCGTGIYCPGNPVRRDQMAVFLLKAEHGSSVRAAGVRRDLSRRALLVELRAVDRAARGRGDHGRLRRRQLLPDEQRHARPDGGIPGQHVLASIGGLP